MTNTHSVWTVNTSPQWQARNGGNPAMVLGQADHYNANFMANRLQLLIPGLEVAVKDAHGNFVPIVPEADAYYELVEKPCKQALGLPPTDHRHTPDGCKDSCSLAVDHDGPCP